MSHGSLSAGPAAEIEEGFDLVDLNELLTGGQDGCQLWQINGTSMVPEIADGAIVATNPNIEPRHRQIVAFRLNGLVGVKRFEHTERRLRLVPANPDLEPRDITPADRFRILGVVTGMVKLF